MTLDYRAQAREGIKRSAAHAYALDPEWSRTAYAMLDAYCAQFPRAQFTSESFRLWCEARQFPIPVPKALGAIFQRAARNGIIKRDGFAVAKERHGSPTIQWLAA